MTAEAKAKVKAQISKVEIVGDVQNEIRVEFRDGSVSAYFVEVSEDYSLAEVVDEVSVKDSIPGKVNPWEAWSGEEVCFIKAFVLAEVLRQITA